MSEKNPPSADRNHRRVQRLKKCIILMLALAIALPVMLCIVLLIRISGLNKTLDVLSMQLEDLAWIVEEQQQDLEELTEELHVYRKAGPVVTNRAATWQGQLNFAGDTPTQPEDLEEQADSEQPLHRVYLTFDDGPSIYTDDILEILDRYGVKATFFVVGKESESDKEALTMIVDGGHTLGMHSYSHKYAELYQSVEAFAEDFVKLQDYLYEVTGVESRFYRFPGGSSNTVSDIDMEEFAEYLASQDVQFYDWNIASGDASSVQLSVDTLVRNSMAGIRENSDSIILFHDSADKRNTVDALPIIIERIQAMEDTVILPITEETVPIQHIYR
ncbi:MAG: polysaccharide deacetylase [Blautia sp.]|nr:polysaccharide deacetylase [Blautia sp.]